MKHSWSSSVWKRSRILRCFLKVDGLWAFLRSRWFHSSLTGSGIEPDDNNCVHLRRQIAKVCSDGGGGSARPNTPAHQTSIDREQEVDVRRTLVSKERGEASSRLSSHHRNPHPATWQATPCSSDTTAPSPHPNPPESNSTTERTFVLLADSGGGSAVCCRHKAWLVSLQSEPDSRSSVKNYTDIAAMSYLFVWWLAEKELSLRSEWHYWPGMTLRYKFMSMK